MRQILNMPSTPECRNASTCGFFARKRRRARGFRDLPHTSGRRFRKCGKTEIRRPDPYFELMQPAVLLKKSGCARWFPIFPALPKIVVKPSVEKRRTRQSSSDRQPVKRKKRLSAAPTNQTRRTVAWPLHSWSYKEKHNPSQSIAKKSAAIMNSMKKDGHPGEQPSLRRTQARRLTASIPFLL